MKIQVFRRISTVDLNCSLREAKKIIERLIESHGPNAKLVPTSYSDGDIDIHLMDYREETDLEYQRRMASEKRADSREKEEYLRLKKKFEK